MPPEHGEPVLRLQLSSRPNALVRVAQVLAHRGIQVRSLKPSSTADEPAGASAELIVVHPRDHERAVRFLARCIDVISIDAGCGTAEG